jgi:hypothetical protein
VELLPVEELVVAELLGEPQAASNVAIDRALIEPTIICLIRVVFSLLNMISSLCQHPI